MATQVANTISFGNDSAAVYADKLYTLFSRYSNKFSYESGSDTIRINNQFDIVLYRDGGYGHLSIKILNPANNQVLRSQVMYMGGSNAGGNYDTYIIYTDNLFYCRFYMQNSTGVNGGIFCWIHANNKNFVSITPNANYSTPRSNWNIENDAYITCPEEADTSYRIKKLADYQLSLRDLFFSEINVLVASNGNFATVSDFKSSSTVAYPGIVSANNKNYYTIGTNTLVELDN